MALAAPQEVHESVTITTSGRTSSPMVIPGARVHESDITVSPGRTSLSMAAPVEMTQEVHEERRGKVTIVTPGRPSLTISGGSVQESTSSTVTTSEKKKAKRKL